MHVQSGIELASCNACNRERNSHITSNVKEASLSSHPKHHICEIATRGRQTSATRHKYMPLLTNKLGLSAQFGKAQLGHGQSPFDVHLNATKCLGQDTSAIPGSDLANGASCAELHTERKICYAPPSGILPPRSGTCHRQKVQEFVDDCCANATDTPIWDRNTPCKTSRCLHRTYP